MPYDEDQEQTPLTFEQHIEGHVMAIYNSIVSLAMLSETGATIKGHPLQQPDVQQIRTSIAALILQPLADLNRLSHAVERIAVVLEKQYAEGKSASTGGGAGVPMKGSGK